MLMYKCNVHVHVYVYTWKFPPPPAFVKYWLITGHVLLSKLLQLSCIYTYTCIHLQTVLDQCNGGSVSLTPLDDRSLIAYQGIFYVHVCVICFMVHFYVHVQNRKFLSSCAEELECSVSLVLRPALLLAPDSPGAIQSSTGVYNGLTNFAPPSSPQPPMLK